MMILCSMYILQASIEDHKDKISNLKEMLDSLEEQNHPLM